MTEHSQAVRTGLPFPMRIALWAALATIIAIPVTAKILLPQMPWSAGDFAVAATGLGLLGALIELGCRASTKWSYRLAATGAVLGAFLLVWINLAVGFIGNEDNPLNLAYFAMLAVVLIGGAAFRFRASAMAGLMMFCAVAQLAILLLGRQPIGFEWVATGVFCVGWLGAAALFRNAAQG